MSYRGISLVSCLYKIYCSILNDRVTNWVEEQGLLEDEQGGSRKKRSTVNQISSLTSTVETLKKIKIINICGVHRL